MQFQRQVQIDRFLVANELVVQRVAVETAIGVIANVGHVEGSVFGQGSARQEADLALFMFGHTQREPVFGLVGPGLGDQVDGAGEGRASEQRGLRALDHFDPLDDIERERQDRIVVEHAVNEDRGVGAAENLGLPADHRPAAAALHAVAVQFLEREARRELADVHHVGQAPFADLGRRERADRERHVLDPLFLLARRHHDFLDFAGALLGKRRRRDQRERAGEHADSYPHGLSSADKNPRNIRNFCRQVTIQEPKSGRQRKSRKQQTLGPNWGGTPTLCTIAAAPRASDSPPPTRSARPSRNRSAVSSMRPAYTMGGSAFARPSVAPFS